MSSFLVEPLSIAQALISLHRIKGSCIPNSFLTSCPAQGPGSHFFLPDKLQVCWGRQDTMHNKPSAAPTSHNSPKALRAQESGPKTSGSHQPEVFHSSLPLIPAGDPAPCDLSQAASRVSAHLGKVLGRTDGHQECPSQEGCTLLGEPNSWCLVTGPSSSPQLHCGDHLTPWWSCRQEQHPQGASELLQLTPCPWSSTLKVRRLLIYPAFTHTELA